MASYQKILLAVDLSEDTGVVTSRARSLAEVNHASLDIIHVIEPIRRNPGPGAGPAGAYRRAAGHPARPPAPGGGTAGDRNPQHREQAGCRPDRRGQPRPPWSRAYFWLHGQRRTARRQLRRACRPGEQVTRDAGASSRDPCLRAAAISACGLPRPGRLATGRYRMANPVQVRTR
jgi:Universal stress protein family